MVSPMISESDDTDHIDSLFADDDDIKNLYGQGKIAEVFSHK